MCTYRVSELDEGNGRDRGRYEAFQQCRCEYRSTAVAIDGSTEAELIELAGDGVEMTVRRRCVAHAR